MAVPTADVDQGVQDNQAIRAEENTLEFNLGDILNRAGVPSKIQKQMRESKAASVKPEAQPAPEVPHGTTEITVPSDAAPEIVTEPPASVPEPQPEPEPEPPPTAEDEKTKFTKQIEELTGKVTAFETEKSQLQEKLKALESQPQVEPIVLAPTRDNPFAAVQNVQQLKQYEDGWQLVKDWAIRNWDGIENEDDPSKNISAKQVRENFADAENFLRHVPIRRQQLIEKDQADAQARAEFPSLYDRTSEDYKLSQSILKDFPLLINHPQRNYIIGVFLEGYKAVKARKTTKPETNDIPPKLLEKHAPVAPPVPNRPSRIVSSQVNKKKAEEEANTELRKAKGDPRVASRLLQESWQRDGRFTAKQGKVLV